MRGYGWLHELMKKAVGCLKCAALISEGMEQADRQASCFWTDSFSSFFSFLSFLSHLFGLFLFSLLPRLDDVQFSSVDDQ